MKIINRRQFIEKSLVGIGSTAMAPLAASAQEAENWRDPELKNLQVTASPPQGERYEAEVPDTVELLDYAHRSINMGTRLLAPEWDYEQFFWCYMDKNPPVLELGHGSLLGCGPKIVEALPMLRALTGSSYNIEIDGKEMGSFVHATGRDGLCYYPVENRPWSFFDEATQRIGKPYADIFHEGRQILAYARWYEHDRNPLWKKLAEKKVQTLRQMTLKQGDTYYFRLGRGYTPWDKDRTKGTVVPIGDHKDYEGDRMVGTPAAYISGFIPQAGALWYRLVKMEEALELGGGLARYLYRYGELLDPETGKFLADHETHTTHSLLGNLSWAVTVNDRQMIEWVRKSYEWEVNTRDPDKVGIVFPQEACAVSDLIGVGIMLSRAGFGDYWETVDRWVRNTYLNLQRLDAADIKSQPLNYLKHTDVYSTGPGGAAISPTRLGPGFAQPDDAADRVIGVWTTNLTNSKLSALCCNGNCARILYYIWDSVLTSKGDQLRVNLLLNRASPWADVDSWIPYEGRVTIRMKVEKRDVLMRIPEGTERAAVSCQINGVVRAGTWTGNYVHLGPSRAGDRIVVNFPVEKKVVSAQLTAWRNPKFPINCRITIKAGTVLDIDAPGLYDPISRQSKYRAHSATMRKVTRFVSAEEFMM
jgi:hypothetical protein